MTEGDDHWRAVEELFHQVCQVSPTAREALLATAEPALAAEVRSLLAAEEDVGAEFDGLARDVVAGALEQLPPVAAGGLPVSIGPYRVIRELGHGGFGTVYLAEKIEEGFRLEVAVKLVHAGLGPRDLERRLLLERHILARLEHRNIARLIDGGTAVDGRPFLVMERVEGEPIDVYCDHHRLSLTQRLRLVLEVCSAVAYAHRALVIHRDIKPSNILVTADEDVKLLDFGIAKLLDAGLPAGDGSDETDETETVRTARLTITGQLPFTPDYASPEQVSGGVLGTQTDVYSLGALLYRLLTGRQPYRLDPPWVPSRIEKIVRETVPPKLSDVVRSNSGGQGQAAELAALRASTPEALERTLRGDLDKIIAMALRKEPERRYQSVQHLADDLRRHLQNRPVQAVGNSWAYVVGRFIRRRRLAVASAALVLLVLAGGIVSTTRQMRQAERHQARTDQVMRLLLDDVFGAASPERARGEMPSARQILDRSAGDLDRRLVASSDLHATVLVAMGRLYQRLGVYDRSQVFLQRGHDRLRTLRGAEHQETLAAASDLADVFFDLGHHRAAYQMLDEVVAGQRRLGEDGLEDLSTSLHRLALVQAGDERAAAEASLAEALDLRRGLYGDGSLPVAESLAVRGKLEHQRRDYAAAEVSVREALTIRREAHGPDHPDVLVSLNDLAVIVQARGDLAAAEELFRSVVEINEKIHGPEHRNLANALNNLGWVMGGRGEQDAAVAQIDRALEIYRVALGDDHPLISDVQRNLARLHQKAASFGLAEQLLLDNLARCRRVDDDESLCVARAHLDLASLDFQRGSYQAAAARFADAGDRLAKLLPADDWRRVLPIFERGRALRELGRLSVAEQILRTATFDFARTLGADSQWTRRAQAALGLCLRAQGRDAEGDEWLAPALEELGSELGADHPTFRELAERAVKSGHRHHIPNR